MQWTKYVMAVALGGVIGTGSGQIGQGGPSAVQPLLDDWGVRTIMSLYEATGASPEGTHPSLEYALAMSSAYLRENDIEAPPASATEPKACTYVEGSGGVPRIGGGAGDFDAPKGTALDSTPVNPVSLSVPAGQGELVVVDDFDIPASFATDPAISMLTPQGLSLMLDPAATGDLSKPAHGNLVMFHILRLVGATGVELAPLSGTARVGTRPSWAMSVQTGSATLSLLLVDIDYPDFETAKQALSGLGPNMLVNLSWNIFECGLLEHYRLASEIIPDVPTVTDYLWLVFSFASEVDPEFFLARCQEVVASNPNTGEGLTIEDCKAILTVATTLEIEHFVNGILETDLAPFAALMSGAEAPRIYASTGNQGLNFALAPASWRGVYAVGACMQQAPPSGRAAFSNAALKLLGGFISEEGYYAPGAWFGHALFDPNEGYWGTSFAAPHVAVLEALGGLRGRSPGCKMN